MNVLPHIIMKNKRKKIPDQKSEHPKERRSIMNGREDDNRSILLAGLFLKMNLMVLQTWMSHVGKDPFQRIEPKLMRGV